MMKKAKVVEKYKVKCPYCLNITDASPWAIAHYNIKISFHCYNCNKKSFIPAFKLGTY